MEKTLVERLREIDSIPPHVEGGDRTKEYKKIFEEFRKRNYLVERAIQQKTTFAQESSHIQKRFGGWKNLAPYYASDVGSYRELEEVIGQPKIGTFDTILFNPLGMGSLVSGLVYGVFKSIEYVAYGTNTPKTKERSTAEDGKQASKKIGRRQFFSESRKFALGFGGLSFVMTAIPKITNKYEDLSKAQDDALYLDAKIKEVYRRN